MEAGIVRGGVQPESCFSVYVFYGLEGSMTLLGLNYVLPRLLC